jgi:hypothetical protein
MLNGFRSLDRILRGEATRPADLGEGRVDVPLGALAVVILLLAMLYGVCMGAFALVSRWGTPKFHDGLLQVASSAAKVPALLVLTLLVTGPSLYVFNALLGSRLTLGSLLRLLTASVGVLAALLASFGTILVFFSLCTDSYAFIILLNVALFAVSGGLGLGFLLQTLHRLAAVAPVPMTPVVPVADDPTAPLDVVLPPGPLDRIRDLREQRSVRRVFRIWVVVFGLVGAQMSWVLRPFVLSPTSDFALFRPRASNFFQAVAGKAQALFDDATPAHQGRGW